MVEAEKNEDEGMANETGQPLAPVGAAHNAIEEFVFAPCDVPGGVFGLHNTRY